MPTYDYECPVCGTQKELLRKMSEKDDPVYCDHDGELMNQILGATGIRKGSGLFSMDSPAAKKWGDYNG